MFAPRDVSRVGSGVRGRARGIAWGSEVPSARMAAVRGVTVRFLQALFTGMEEAGLDVPELAARAGMAPEVLADPTQRVPHQALSRLFDLAVETSGDRSLPLKAARHYAPGANVFDYAGVASATLGAALKRVSRYSGLVLESYELVLRREQHMAYMCFVPRPGVQTPPYGVEHFVGVGIVASRHWLGGEVPVEVHFRHEQPDDIREHRELFKGPVRFGQPDDAIVFPSLALDLPLKEADPELSAVLDAQASKLLSESRARSTALSARVRDVLAAELSDGAPTAERVAQRLKMSPRTLRRRLKDEGTSHQRLLDDLRHELSLKLLDVEGLGIDEVALRLGFSESTSFHRAFKRWTGMTPADHVRRRDRQN